MKKIRWMDTLPQFETVPTPEEIALNVSFAMGSQTTLVRYGQLQSRRQYELRAGQKHSSWFVRYGQLQPRLQYELRAGAGIVAWRKQLDPDGKTDRWDIGRHFPDGPLSQRELWAVLEKIRCANMNTWRKQLYPTAAAAALNAATHLRMAEAILRERHHDRLQQADRDA
jgi:hypothetical protein